MFKAVSERLQPNPSDIASCSVNLRPLRKLLVGMKNEAMVQQIKRLPESHNDGRAIKDLDLKKQPINGGTLKNTTGILLWTLSFCHQVITLYIITMYS